jgi:hypothetical protein
MKKIFKSIKRSVWDEWRKIAIFSRKSNILIAKVMKKSFLEFGFQRILEISKKKYNDKRMF